MAILQLSTRFLKSNSYLLVGIIIGIFLHPNISDFDCEDIAVNSYLVDIKSINNSSSILNNSATRPVIVKKSTQGKKPQEKLVRPRYYSTELGIRQKLFMGVLTSEDRVNTQAIYINKTIAHLVDNVKFFITASSKLKTTFNLSGIVGFTDTRQKYRPFQIIKYIGDTFLQDYDYYYLMNDYNYVNVRKLKDIVTKISVSLDVYLGTSPMDSSFCDLDAGILMSNSVMQMMKENLDWCIKNAISDIHSENLGRCIHHSSNLECQESVQEQKLPSYKLKHFGLEKHLQRLTKTPEFNRAITVYPILQAKDFYLLNAYYSQQRLINVRKQINKLSKDLPGSWPPGQRPGAKPATRFDVLNQLYFNTTHMYFPDDFTNIRKHTTANYQDIQRVIEFVKAKVENENLHQLQYRRLVNGYRVFDLSRGMDYTLDMGFRDLNTGKEIIKRYEVCKPLGKVEFLPVPYVTENVRVTILLPIEENQIDLALQFIYTYHKLIMDRKERSFLMLILLYQFDSPSKGKSDVYARLKNVAIKLTNRYRNEDAKIAWVSIRLPKVDSFVAVQESKVLNVAIIDLALKKIGLESLVLVLDLYCNISIEFLNRVRMNTILNFQIFNPIPFRQYNPKISHIEVFEVHKNAGHFDREEYKFISFYGKDYVEMRKQAQDIVPIIRTDNDISKILDDKYKHQGNIFELFVKFNNNLHLMRATDYGLKIKYHEGSDSCRNNLFLGTKVQLAKLIMDVENESGVGL